MNSALAIHVRITPTKLDVGSTTPSLRGRAPDANIKHIIHRNLRNAVLASTDIKVIDAALKYGYDSPESFGRAFSRFHGITPVQAKSGRAKLKSFSRLSVKIILDGGSTMKYRIEKMGELEVIVKKINFPVIWRPATGSCQSFRESAGEIRLCLSCLNVYGK